jgi:hypothetical protein
MALFLRTGKEELAKAKGYDLQKSGILKIESYLQDVLFGSQSQKVQLIIQSNKNEILSLIELLKRSFETQEEYLSKTNLEIKEEYKRFQVEKDELFRALFEIKKTIALQENELREYFEFLHKFLQNRLLMIKDVAKTRVLDDVSYEIRKNKKLPEKKRIEYIVETALKDGLVDLIREYRYEFEKKMQDSFEAIMRIQRIKLSNQEPKEFNSQEFFEKNFKNLSVFQNRVILLKKIYDSIQMYAKKSWQKLDLTIDEILQKTIKELQDLLLEKIEKTDIKLLEDFVNIHQNKIKTLEEEAKSKERLLEDIIKNIKSSSFEKRNRIVEIRSKKEAIEAIEKDLEVLDDSV